jgi:hypothetical protein
VKNKIEDLRNHLFATLEALQDEEKPMDLDRAKVIADVSQTIINSAKVEVDYAKVTGNQLASGFLPAEVKPARGHGPKLVGSGS